MSGGSPSPWSWPWGGCNGHCAAGLPSQPTSLHYASPYQLSAYALALKAVGEIIQDYDSDKLFPAYGFGAKVPPDGKISHQFPLVRPPCGTGLRVNPDPRAVGQSWSWGVHSSLVGGKHPGHILPQHPTAWGTPGAVVLLQAPIFVPPEQQCGEPQLCWH